MKLYVWTHVLTDYTDGIVFAVARSPKHARELAYACCKYMPKNELDGAPQVFDFKTPVCFTLWGGG